MVAKDYRAFYVHLSLNITRLFLFCKQNQSLQSGCFFEGAYGFHN
jgi:hypothetical protein